MACPITSDGHKIMEIAIQSTAEISTVPGRKITLIWMTAF